MANGRENAARWLVTQKLQHEGVDVVYRRGAQSKTVRVILGRKLLKVSGANGPQVVRSDRDFIVLAADLDFGDGPAPPAREDLIDVTLNNVATRFIVTSPARGEPEWQWADEFNIAFRIHAKDQGPVPNA